MVCGLDLLSLGIDSAVFALFSSRLEIASLLPELMYFLLHRLLRSFV